MESKGSQSSTLVADRDHPGHEIFCTPENSQFHSQNSYAALDATRREIRLIELLPDSGRGLIECTLLDKVALADVQGEYYALSYCAGDVNNTGIILVNGVRCTVFANLRHALVAVRHFREKRSPGDRFLMWVDQICINQYDLLERSHQVGFMKDIYQCAQQTLICLSTCKTSTRGMEWLIQLCENVPPRDHGVRPKGATHLELLHEVSSEDEEYDHNHRLTKYIWTRMTSDDFADGWVAFYDVVESPWWSRAWVFQEFIVSRAPLLLYWRADLAWRDASSVLAAFWSMHKHVLRNRANFLAINGYKPGGPEDRRLCRVNDRVKRTNAHAALDTVEFMATTKANWKGSLTLKRLLAHSRYCSASDERDRIYAFLGLAEPGYGIVPDYSADNDIIDVLVKTTKSIILLENSLDVLLQAAAPVAKKRAMLPSWAVDWANKEPFSIRNNLFGGEAVTKLFSIKYHEPNVSFRTVKSQYTPRATTALEVSGVFLATLTARTPFDLLNLVSPEEKKVYVTFKAGDYITSCTAQSQPSDQLWIVHGVSLPLILRRAAPGYVLVSCAPAFSVPRMMRIGDISDELLERGELKTERILIV
ncbi:hypothetical protein S40288_04974 [Stachybotrys chartarum IBT 40288]|nr:hypothetical protein S40288_04974 [Stachybotrys chartarum IBT 40288]